MPFIHDHRLMLQHDNARPHVARICTQFLEAENIPVLAWSAYSPDMSPIEHVVLSEDPVLRYQVGTKKMKTSRYQMFLSPGGTEYRLDPVFAA